MHVPKIPVSGMYHRWRDMYLKNALLRTDTATLATVVLPNAAVFSASVGYLKYHWMRSFHFLKDCSCLLEGNLAEHQYSWTVILKNALIHLDKKCNNLKQRKNAIALKIEAPTKHSTCYRKPDVLVLQSQKKLA